MEYEYNKRFVRSLVMVSCFLSHTAFADVVAVVSAKNPITSLTANQLADIYLGRSERFPDGTPAVPCDISGDSALREEFYTKLLGKSQAQVRAHWAKLIFTGRGQPPQEVSTSEEAKRLVSEKINAICYIDRAQVDRNVTVLFPK